jgi:hypothetical protein
VRNEIIGGENPEIIIGLVAPIRTNLGLNQKRELRIGKSNFDHN